MSFGDFVVSCMPIVRQEAMRLSRLGVPVSIDDAVQDGCLALLESAAVFAGELREPRAMARIVVRRKLQTWHVARPTAGNRKAMGVVQIDAGETDAGLAVASCEHAVVVRLTVEAMAREPGFGARVAMARKQFCGRGHFRERRHGRKCWACHIEQQRVRRMAA